LASPLIKPEPCHQPLVIASQNRGKRSEIAAVLQPLKIEALPAELTEFPEVIEDGSTFTANALKKARAFASRNGLPALADDSGLMVDALGGAPGVYSSRYAGKDATDADNNAKLLHELRHQKNRTARFHCSLCLVYPDNRPGITAEGEVRGYILEGADGSQGFGYDPIFFCPELGKSFGRASAEEKALVSHRGRALRQLATLLTETKKF